MAGHYEVKRAKDGQTYFNLVAGNGEVILTSEMYVAKRSALAGIRSVQANSAQSGRYAKLVSKSGKPYFTLKAGNHQVIGQSEMYETDKARDNGIASVTKNGATEIVKDLTA